MNGFLDDFGRVGEGRTGISSSSSSSSEVKRVGCHLASAAAAAAKMLRPALGAFVAPPRRGERDKDAIDIGEGSDISTSIGVPAPAAYVCARPNGVLVLFLRGFMGSGESIESSVKSVDEGKSMSPLVLTDDRGMSLPSWEPEPENSLADNVLAVLDRFCTSTSTRTWTS